MKLKNIVKSVGKVARQAAPYMSLIPGVGTVASGLTGGLGALAEGKGISGALKSGLGAAASSGMIGSMSGGKGIQGITANIAKQGGYQKAGINVLGNLGSGKNPLAGFMTPDPSVASTPPDVIEGHVGADGQWVADAPTGGPTATGPGGTPLPGTQTSSSGNTGGGIMDWVKANPQLLLAAGSGIMGATQQAAAARRRDKALSSLQDEYNGRAPLRSLSTSMLTQPDPRLASLGSIFRGGNPYAQ